MNIKKSRSSSHLIFKREISKGRKGQSYHNRWLILYLNLSPTLIQKILPPFGIETALIWKLAIKVSQMTLVGKTKVDQKAPGPYYLIVGLPWVITSKHSHMKIGLKELTRNCFHQQTLWEKGLKIKSNHLYDSNKSLTYKDELQTIWGNKIWVQIYTHLIKL
jgi:hypothetical protein